MFSRPRVTIVGTVDSAQEEWAEILSRFDVSTVANADEAVEQLRSVLDGETPFAEEIVEKLGVGVAIVGQDFAIHYRNQRFSELCEGRARANVSIYDAIGCDPPENPEKCPFVAALAGRERAKRLVVTPEDRHLDLVVSSAKTPGDQVSLVCAARDMTTFIKQRRKLVAIHRAGLELTNLRRDELARMTVAERTDLLKANILQYAQRILNFHNLEVRLLDPATKRLDILLSEGIEASDRSLYAKPTGNGVTGYVAAMGESYICDDALNDPLYLRGAPDARSSLTVPLIFRERVIGVFNVESPRPGLFSTNDREFLELFAREIAVALNTLDLLQAEKSMASSDTVAEILQAVSLPLDDVVADAIEVLESTSSKTKSGEDVSEAVVRILQCARDIRGAILDIRKRHSATRRDAGGPEAETLLTGRKVLVADADAAVRRSAHDLLSQLGCEVDTAKSGYEALRKLDNLKFDAILGDIRLPDMNGYEFFRRVREVGGDVPVVLMTGFGYDPTHSIVKAKPEGLRSTLYKPFRIDRLGEAIRLAIDPEAAPLDQTRLDQTSSRESIL